VLEASLREIMRGREIAIDSEVLESSSTETKSARNKKAIDSEVVLESRTNNWGCWLEVLNKSEVADESFTERFVKSTSVTSSEMLELSLMLMKSSDRGENDSLVLDESLTTELVIAAVPRESDVVEASETTTSSGADSWTDSAEVAESPADSMMADVCADTDSALVEESETEEFVSSTAETFSALVEESDVDSIHVCAMLTDSAEVDESKTEGEAVGAAVIDSETVLESDVESEAGWTAKETLSLVTGKSLARKDGFWKRIETDSCVAAVASDTSWLAVTRREIFSVVAAVESEMDKKSRTRKVTFSPVALLASLMLNNAFSGERVTDSDAMLVSITVIASAPAKVAIVIDAVVPAVDVHVGFTAAPPGETRYASELG
jgi:hypothetical protein